MFIVRHTYFNKAVKYARMHGKAEFSAGGAIHDVFDVIREYGIVPEEVYTGLNYGHDRHQHSELDAALKGYMDAIIKSRVLTTAWHAGLNGILDAYLGAVPDKFTYKGREYTPKSFAQSLGIVADDYITFTSYTHHPFYTEVALEIPDNWAWGKSWNVPMEDMMRTLDFSLEKGYTVTWCSDVSEPGFQYARGFAVAATNRVEDMTGNERARWDSMSARDRQNVATTATEPLSEVTVTQEIRQRAFDNRETTDDHGMVITGTATDQRGHKFYYVKNSWGTNQLYDGYFYASVPFVAYKTMSITVHRDAIPADIKKKMGIR
jgi:bleomycin hydrolase